MKQKQMTNLARPKSATINVVKYKKINKSLLNALIHGPRSVKNKWPMPKNWAVNGDIP